MVTVVGCGYVGLGVGLALALLGHRVSFVDTDRSKVALLRRGRTPFYEPGLEETVRRAADRTTYTADYREALARSDTALIAVGTPPDPDGSANLAQIDQAVRSLAENVSSAELLVAIKSTVPPGTARRVALMLGRLRPGVAWHVAANPEFLRQGWALFDALYPSRIVIGAADPATADRLEMLYRRLVDRDFPRPSFLPEPERPGPVPVIKTSPETAELSKYAANAFLAARVSLINEIANICDLAEADVTEVARTVGLDPRIGPDFLEAGLGYGGGCLPKDTLALCRAAEEAGYVPGLLRAVGEVNDRQRETAILRLGQILGGLAEARVAVLGLAFKPGTADLRGAPSLDMITRLLKEGAQVRAHDPVAIEAARERLPPGVRFCPSVGQALQGADVALLVTAWPEYRTLDWPKLRERMRRPVVFDGRNALDPGQVIAAGLAYYGVGRRAATTEPPGGPGLPCGPKYPYGLRSL